MSPASRTDRPQPSPMPEGLSAAFERAPIGIIHSDLHGRIIRASAVFWEMVGYREGEIESFLDITHPDDVATDAAAVRALAAGEIETYQREKRYLHKDGRTVWVSLSATTSRDASGRPSHVLGIVVDITAQKEAAFALAAAQERYRDLVEGLEAIVWEMDYPPRRFTFVSKRVEEVLGYPVEQWLDDIRTWTDHIHPDDRERVIEHSRENIAAGKDYEFDHRVTAADGREVWLRNLVRVTTDPSGEVVRLRGTMVDITETRMMQDRLREDEERLLLLVEASRTLRHAVNLDEVLDELLRLARQVLAADAHAVWRLSRADGTWNVAASHGLSKSYIRDMAAHVNQPQLGPDAPLPMIVQDMAEEGTGDPDADSKRTGEGIRAMLVVPLIIDGETTGTICFYYRSSRSFTPSDLRLATILADFAATAISSAEAYERANVLRAVAEESARVVQSVQRITDAALSKLGLQDLLHELLRRVRETLKADVATILLTSESGTELTMSVHEGLDRTWEGPVRMPVGRGIAGTIASTLRATVIDDISKVEVVSEFLRRTVKSLAGVPLLVEGRLIGVLHVATVKPRHFSDQDVQLLQLVGDRVGLAIEQARLFEAEREVRIQAEQARETVAFIAESTRSLSASLNVDETLKRLANLAVPALADLCLIDVVDESGRIRRVTASVSEAHGPILRELEERYPLQDAPRGVMHVITTGETLFVPVVDVSRLSEVAQDARHLELLWQIGPRSYIIVPLITRGRTIGALSVASIEAARTYREEDVIIVEEVARRAAIAIENARLYRAAQEAARQREEFLSIASHELKTPLTTVKGYVQMLERELQRTDLSNDRVRELFGELQGQVRRFEDLVLDLLDASRLQRSRLDLQPEQADLVAILRSVMTRMERSTEFLPSHRLIAEMPESIEGTWDAARLDQVFMNLIANALKYSPQGGDVRVSARQHDGFVEVAVRDSGIGIAEDDFGAIFEPFVRGKVGRRGISGTGLGLYVARQIVEQHGGTISVESALGKGSTFIVRLPMVANTDS